MQSPSPEHGPPLQPRNTDPSAGVAVSVTCVPSSSTSEQSAPHSTPSGALVIVPDPDPVADTERTWRATNSAVTERFWSSVTVQVPVPAHAPLQPRKTEPLAGVAVRVTRVPDVCGSRQSVPQSIPGGDEVILPVPEPSASTSSQRNVGCDVVDRLHPEPNLTKRAVTQSLPLLCSTPIPAYAKSPRITARWVTP